MTITPDDLRALADGLANQNSEAERVAARYAASADMLAALKHINRVVSGTALESSYSAKDLRGAIEHISRAAIDKAERAEP